MTRQTINLFGALLVAVIILVGVLLGVLPHLSQASQNHQQRDTVAQQNQTQETLIEAYARRREQLPALQQQVETLRRQITDGPHLEQLIALSARLPDGATLVSITPQETADGESANVTDESGFASRSVTLGIELRNAADAAAVLDGLRAGPRLFAIDHVVLGDSGVEAKKGTALLTVTGRVFMREAS